MDLIKRIIIAIIFIPALIIIYYLGGYVLLAFLAAVTALCTYEIIKMYRQKGINLLYLNIALSVLLYIVIAAQTRQALSLLDWITDNYILYVILLVIMCNSAWDVFRNKIEGSVQRLSGSLLAVIYPALGLGLMFRLSEVHQTLVPLLAIIVWISDSAAYFVGMGLGKHRGIFLCSPQKSIEGFIAGFVSAIICGFACQLIFPEVYTIMHTIMFTISVGILGQYGDLVESIIKRDMHIKDSSNMLPGHGGMLDRFDSLLIASAMMYILITILSPHL